MPVRKLTSKGGLFSGVDINRNYGYKFGIDDEGSVADPCDEIYRGVEPFSEYETRAVRDLVESSGIVNSAMNFHAYGNLWITPYCYHKGIDNFELMKPKIADFYQTFEKEIKTMGFYKTGDADETIHYPANGEASDWMLGVHNIVSFSPELGSDFKSSSSFYPQKEVIPEVINLNYKVVELFITKSMPDFTESAAGYMSLGSDVLSTADSDIKTRASGFIYKVSLQNSSLASVRDVKVTMGYDNRELPNVLNTIYVYATGVTKASTYTIDPQQKAITLNNTIGVEKLEGSFLYLELSAKIKLMLTVKLTRDNMPIYFFESKSNGILSSHFTVMPSTRAEAGLLAILAVFTIIGLSCVFCYCCKNRRNEETHKIIEIVKNVQEENINMNDNRDT